MVPWDRKSMVRSVRNSKKAHVSNVDDYKGWDRWASRPPALLSNRLEAIAKNQTVGICGSNATEMLLPGLRKKLFIPKDIKLKYPLT